MGPVHVASAGYKATQADCKTHRVGRLTNIRVRSPNETAKVKNSRPEILEKSRAQICQTDRIGSSTTSRKRATHTRTAPAYNPGPGTMASKALPQDVHTRRAAIAAAPRMRVCAGHLGERLGRAPRRRGGPLNQRCGGGDVGVGLRRAYRRRRHHAERADALGRRCACPYGQTEAHYACARGGPRVGAWAPTPPPPDIKAKMAAETHGGRRRLLTSGNVTMCTPPDVARTHASILGSPTPRRASRSDGSHNKPNASGCTPPTSYYTAKLTVRATCCSGDAA